MFLENRKIAKLNKIFEYDDGCSLYEYTPSLLHPLLFDYEPMKFVRRCRYFFEYMHLDHYKVYYLSVKNDFVGFCVVSPGGRKLKCSNKDDIILAPYFIEKSKRGQGYSKRLIMAVLNEYPNPYNCAFDWIMKTNIPSIRASEACGFKKIAELNVTGIMRKLCITDDGLYNLYLYSHL